MKFFVRFLLLGAGFSLFTFGLLEWAHDNFTLRGLLPFTAEFRTQGLHYLMLGLAMIPPSLWEIFHLERRVHSTLEQSVEQEVLPTSGRDAGAARGNTAADA